MGTRAVVRVGLAAGVVGAGSSAALAQVSFVERTDVGVGSFAISPASMASGVSAVDYDQDGDVDLLVPTGLGHPPQLLQNDGSGVFTDVTVAAGLGGVTSNDRSGLFVDYDNDGDLDLVLACDHRGHGAIINTYTWESTVRLFRQDGGVFTEVTAAEGIDGLLTVTGSGDPSSNMHIGGLSAGDVDGDGVPEIYVGIWTGPQHLFTYKEGTYSDVTGTLNAPGGVGAQFSNWQPTIYDMDGDGALDIFCAIDFADNQAYINQGDGTFQDDSVALGLDNAWNEMGVAVADYDNDGDLDIYITNINDPTGLVAAWTDRHNVLYRNDGPGATPQYVEVSEQAGVDGGDWGWGCDFADLDLDGRADIIATNGFATATPFFVTDTTKLFHNQGGSPVAFSEIGASAGVDDDDIASGLVTADFDRDGDLDYVQVVHDGSVRYMENTTPRGANRWVVVRPRRHDGLDRFSIGATVTVIAGGQTMTRVITAGASVLSQKAYEAHFGLGAVGAIDRIEVVWPDGKKRVVLNDPRVDTVLTLVPAEPGADTYDAALDDVPFGGYTGRRIQPDPRDYPERD